MKPQQIVVAENYKPGAVSKIVLIDKTGKEHVVKRLKPKPIKEEKRILCLPLHHIDFETTSMKLYLDIKNFEEMPQIDAIGMSEEKEAFQPKINLANIDMAGSDAVNLGDSVNTIFKEIAPIISPDNRTLYFTRDNDPQNIGGEKQDIWYSEIDSAGRFKKARNLGKPINNERNNNACAITPDGQTMLVGHLYSKEGLSGGDGLSISRKIDGAWTMPEKLNIRNYDNQGKFFSAYLANDGKTLLISITRSDTQGGEDIYVSFQTKNGTWTTPLNLGNKINTASDEYTPFLASDLTTLYFSSDGMPGFGKGDIYMSKRLDDSWKNWSEPVNLGPVFNTALSDYYFTIPASGEYAYYVSASQAKGASDIFRIKLPKEIQPNAVVLVKGRVLNAVTRKPLAAKIYYETLPQGDTKGEANTEAISGKYKMVLPPGSLYGFRASCPGYLSVNENINLNQIDRYVEIEKDLLLVPIEAGQMVRLNNLFFDSRKAEFSEASFPELNRLVNIMNENPSIEIEIGGHTDHLGSEQDNVLLSQARADKIREYLSQKGISTGRMLAKGYGESKPLVPNDTETNRQLNRRVEFLILKK